MKTLAALPVADVLELAAPYPDEAEIELDGEVVFASEQEFERDAAAPAPVP
jgi:hypothetical protein